MIDPQIKRLAARYGFAFFLFTIAVIIGVWMGIRAQAENSEPALPITDTVVRPATKTTLVVDGGVSCESACALEAVCGLRDPDTCRKQSCDGALRKPSSSDLLMASAPDCVNLAASACEEACKRRGDCSNDHDAACTKECAAKAQTRPRETYRASRCVIENGCSADACPPT